ncbi:hypothetical protein LshimejAT787_0506830 [Lyophyllum shimeji]|uniref:Uncharacterized protein n=1 Tax=Lyophyllum shimeji TaxID=47721 RepID=A0A9P3PMW5_LYOSH|nr:hypothetical protein LshimejAT787_0506830 [Lyophyllum shimeji]
MTGSAPPPAATNKAPTPMSSGSATTSTAATAASTTPSVPAFNTDSQILDENVLRTERNTALQTRRDAGEIGVPADELLLPLLTLRATTTPPPTASNSNNLIQFASAFSQFSPNTQNQAMNLLTNASTPSTLPSRILFSSTQELPALPSTTDFSYGIHPFIVTLAKNKLHLPLTIFTSRATKKLHTETTSLKQNTVYNSANTKCHILDLSQFQDEASIDIIDWHEAWQRYMVFLDTHCDIEVASRWRAHYHFLCAHDDFRLNFTAIREFDIAERTRYSINPRAHNKESYLRHLESIKLEVMSRNIRNATRDLGQDFQSSMGAKTRFKPYDSDGRRPRAALADTSKPSFRDGRPADTTRSPPLCLCCKRTGHKFSECTEDTTPAGVPTHSSSTPQSAPARPTIQVNTLAPGAAPPTTGPALGSVSEAPLAPPSFLETPLALISFYRDWRSLPLDTVSPAPHIYFDNLQIEAPSPYDKDRDYARIHTPYSAAQFRLFLEHAQLLHRYPELPLKLARGFPIGNLSPITRTYTPPNLPGATLHADTIRTYIADELRLGRFTGPFTRDELEGKIGPFRSSPLQVATKEGAPGEPTKYRVCRHLSYKGKAHASINDEIDSDKYPTRWGKAIDVAKIVTAAPPGAQAATLDVEGAYRTIPVKPDHKRYLIVHFEGCFYMDHDVPFGLASASGLQGEVADATIDIWEHHQVSPAVNGGAEYTYDYDLVSMKEMIAPLGIPWHKDKGQEFADTFPYLGFHWDLPNKTVSLPDLKRKKYLRKLSLFIAECETSRIPKTRAESIIGTLSHITFVHQYGRSYMSNLYNWLTTFVDDYRPRWITSSALTDLRWWSRLLLRIHAPRSLSPPEPTRDYSIWVDASTEWGIGLLWGTRWAAWRHLDGWRGPGRDIGWLEGVAVELAILAARAIGIRDADILIRSDNEGVIGAFRKGRCSNFMTNLSIRRSEETPSLVAFSPPPRNNSLTRSRSLSPSLPTFPMSRPDRLTALLDGVDVQAQAAAFYANAPPLDVRRAASLPTDGRIRVPRKPRKDAHITPSFHRPHVLASERVLRWTTPHSEQFQASIEAELPNPAILKLFKVMLFSLDENTRSNYGAGLLRFTQYCDTHHIPEHSRMPASELLLSAFSASAAGSASESALNNWLAGLQYWHVVNGAPWHGSDMLHHVRRGFAKLVPPSSKRAKRPPVTIEALIALRSGLDLSNAFDAAVWAVASVAFWSCCRLGELIIPSQKLFNPSKHVARNMLPIHISRLSSGAEHSTFHIPWTKTTAQEGADISVTARDHLTCPLSALRHHLAANTAIPSTAPLFAFETADGGWAPMTKPWFMDRCNAVWVAAGFPSMPGHAFRIGGATELLLQGTDPNVVATQGRWQSRAFLEYWRRIDAILPLFISNAANSHRARGLEAIMDTYARSHRLPTSSH